MEGTPGLGVRKPELVPKALCLIYSRAEISRVFQCLFSPSSFYSTRTSEFLSGYKPAWTKDYIPQPPLQFQKRGHALILSLPLS